MKYLFAISLHPRSSGEPRVSHLCDIEYDNNEFIIEYCEK